MPAETVMDPATRRCSEGFVLRDGLVYPRAVELTKRFGKADWPKVGLENLTD